MRKKFIYTLLFILSLMVSTPEEPTKSDPIEPEPHVAKYEG
jgi:hypothetical protein